MPEKIILQTTDINLVSLMEKHGLAEPLVSIIVITYNSANFVLETLESIRSQTYRNIELVITDDCSTDDTVAICNKWTDKNKHRFTGTEMITAVQNTGIPANCNRGLFKAKGEWIKYIAGDDLLEDSCIEKNINFILNSDLKAIFSKKVNFSGSFNDRKVQSISLPSIFNNQKLTASDQYDLLVRGIGCPPNTMFISREALLNVKGYDEEFPLFEDWPMNMRLTRAGFRIGFMDEITVYYRIHNDSVYHKESERNIYRDFDKNTYHPAYMKYAFPDLTWDEKLFYLYKHAIVSFFYTTRLNRSTYINRTINHLLIAPYRLHKAFREAMLKRKILPESVKKAAKLNR